MRNLSKVVRPPRRPLSTRIQGEAGRQEPFSIKDVGLVVPDGVTIAVLGPSGCGKTTLLKLIAGLMKPDSGRVLYDGLDMTDVPTGERDIGMVFQNYALYPTFTTDENVLAKFRFQHRTPELDAEAREKFERTCDLMGVEITDLLGRFPDHLSGGEKQRVAIARCITRDPTVFLMDEPFASLDMQMRLSYRLKLKRLLQNFSITTIYVTHDQLEARVIADVIAVMRDGRILQLGTYQQLYEYPQTRFVAEFLNLDPATVSINMIEGGGLHPDLAGKVAGIRPEDISATTESDTSGVEGVVTHVSHDPLEKRTILNATVHGTEVQASLRQEIVTEANTRLWFRFDRIHLFDEQSGIRETTRAGSALP